MASLLNIINIAAYVLNVTITYGSNLGWFGPTNTVLSDKYQTLVTPAGWAFSIWGLIFLSEGVFAVAQLLPRYRDSAAVKHGVGYWWLAVCVCQCVWTPLFAQEVLWAQLLAMFAILFSLLGLVRSAAAVVERGDVPTSEYWLFVAPFSLHLGWIVAASTVAMNVTALYYSAGDAANVAASGSARTMIALSIVSFAYVLLVAFSSATVLFRRPNAFVPGVAAWALLAISKELGSPREAISTSYPPAFYQAVMDAAAVFSIAAALLCVAVIVFRAIGGRLSSQPGGTEIPKFDSSLSVGIHHEGDEV